MLYALNLKTGPNGAFCSKKCQIRLDNKLFRVDSFIWKWDIGLDLHAFRGYFASDYDVCCLFNEKFISKDLVKERLTKVYRG